MKGSDQDLELYADILHESNLTLNMLLKGPIENLWAELLSHWDLYQDLAHFLIGQIRYLSDDNDKVQALLEQLIWNTFVWRCLR